tara:strand:- start:394 stop:567 length:174 start_codon:yes stop_codon:yes gene_type:complete
MKNIVDLDFGPDLIKLNKVKYMGFTKDFTYEKEINIFQFFGDRLKLIRKYIFDKITK